MHMITAAANNVALIEGTGATCGTGSAGMAGGTTAASGYNLAANGGIAFGSGLGTVMQTATTGDSVCVVTQLRRLGRSFRADCSTRFTTSDSDTNSRQLRPPEAGTANSTRGNYSNHRVSSVAVDDGRLMRKLLLIFVLFGASHCYGAVAHVATSQGFCGSAASGGNISAVCTAVVTTKTFSYTATTTGNVVLFSVGCSCASAAATISIAASGWTITTISTGAGASGSRMAFFKAYAPNTSAATFTITMSVAKTCTLSLMGWLGHADNFKVEG
jgi:hypothetical protein